jgi:hypothetical protein
MIILISSASTSSLNLIKDAGIALLRKNMKFDLAASLSQRISKIPQTSGDIHLYF